MQKLIDLQIEAQDYTLAYAVDYREKFDPAGIINQDSAPDQTPNEP